MITIDHSGDGTLVRGTRRDDAASRALKDAGFRWSGRLDAWYLNSTWGYSTRQQRVDQVVKALTEQGIAHEVTGARERSTTADERAEARRNRSAERADRLDARADKSEAQGTARIEAADRFFQDAMGTPVLTDHYSGRAYANKRDKNHRRWEKGYEEVRAAAHDRSAASVARSNSIEATDPGYVQRKIKSLETEQRDIERKLERNTEGKWHDELVFRSEEVTDELGYFNGLLGRLVENGARVWTKADFEKGDFAKVGGTWREIVRVNAKSLTVKTPYSWTDTVPYDKVTGRHTDRVIEQETTMTTSEQQDVWVQQGDSLYTRQSGTGYAELVRGRHDVWHLNVNEPGESLRHHYLGDSDDIEHVKKVAEATIANPNYQEPAFLGLAGGTLEQAIEAEILLEQRVPEHGTHLGL